MVAGAMVVLCGATHPVRARGGAPSFYEMETKYSSGFTEGSGIGLEGEKEFSIDTVGRFGKRDGRYAATETKFEFDTRRTSTSSSSSARLPPGITSAT
jgi:hypothetical protein